MIDISNELTIELNKAILKAISSNPTTRTLNIDELSIDDLKRFLQATHSILWANWSVISEDSLEQAAQWFKAQINNLHSYISSQ